MSEPTPSRDLSGTRALADPLVRELLDKRLVGVLATVEPDGSMHAVPLWFAASGETILLATGSRSRKVRNLERDPRGTLVLHDSRPGFEVCGASIRGHVEIVRGAEAVPLVAQVHRRYVTEAGLRLPDATRFLEGDDVALRLVPEAAATWDERKSAAARVLRETGGAYLLEPTTPRSQSSSR